jgi:DNA-binding CsgD family transcriptional regulator
MQSGGALLGREDEQRRVTTVLSDARNGRGGALLLRGDPGIGKTTLLESTTTSPTGMRVLRINGYEAESQIPFAAVQRLIIPLKHHIDSLPLQHQQALHVAAGSAVGAPPDRFLVGLGVLGLLAAAGSETPVVCAIDDAHLIDSESLDAIAFVARRLEAESVAIVFAARDSDVVTAQMAGIPVLRLEGLDRDHAVALLLRTVPEGLDPVIASQIAGATGGNPLALVDLASELSVRQLTESSFGDEPVPVGRHLEAFYLRQIRLLSEPLQTWLLLAAAESTGDLDLISASARQLALDESLGEDGVAAGIVELGPPVKFRHPLVRSAAYNAAHGRDRRRVHQVLSAVADGLGLLERGAWHAAKATLGTDESVAERLEQVADAAGRRGGFASRANVLAQAASLSLGPPRHRRLVAAAEAALAAGKPTLAKSLLDEVDEDLLDDVSRGRMLSISAQLALFTADPAVVRGCADMLEVAGIFRGLDADREQAALIRAWEMYLPVELRADGVTQQLLGTRLREGAGRQPGTASTILDALAAIALDPYEAAVPTMRSAVDQVLALDDEAFVTYGSSSVALTTALWDNTARLTCLRRTADSARDAGSLQTLDTSLWVLSLAETLGGTPRRASQYIEQVRDLRRAIGFDAEHVINVALLAWMGVPREQIVMMAEGAAMLGFGGVRTATLLVVGIIDLARSDYQLAYDVLAPNAAEPFMHVGPLGFPDFVEACSRTDRPDEARAVLEQLESRAAVAGSRWLSGVTARSRALVSPDDEAEEHYLAAVDLLTGELAEVDLARAHLLYGEWLRRRRRRNDARLQLQRAAEIFQRTGADVFLGRTNAELAATGGSPMGPAADLGLTPQEATIATLAAAGSTNAEIGATMFISANTVDYHLRKVFQKLGVSSRRQLHDRLEGGSPAP